MIKLRWFLFQDIGWTQFSLGFCYEDSVADAQLAIFMMLYPEYVFAIRKSE